MKRSAKYRSPFYLKARRRFPGAGFDILAMMKICP
jgi:hypothetical protein